MHYKTLANCWYDIWGSHSGEYKLGGLLGCTGINLVPV